ncbi:MAG: hypothetical protein MJZ13_06115 [Bacteroidales bacterium]|nr:hypothetical protein [Bacteroidales bacterium]
MGKQKISICRPFAQMERKIIIRDSRHFTVGLRMNMQSGSGDMKDEGQLSGVDTDKTGMAVQETFHRKTNKTDKKYEEIIHAFCGSWCGIQRHGRQCLWLCR